MPYFCPVPVSAKYQLVVGLEVHVQLQTRTKLFCADNTLFGEEPNSRVSVISLAHPGTIPRLNQKAVEMAVRLGLALDCQISRNNYFVRKNYFYPDLPKGYQVSQHALPVCIGGQLSIYSEGIEKKIRLHHMHLEEDAGKSLHDRDIHYTCIDLNRAGVPLLEIVTEPDIHSSADAFEFLKELRRLVRWLGVCDGNMEEGSMRCDANISVRPVGSQVLGTRVEVKNLNSIRNVKMAIEHEFDRLVQLVEDGGKVIQETRSFDAEKGTSFTLRSKEDADDYRYFPEPDLPPVHISGEMLAGIRMEMPALPFVEEQRLQHEAGVSAYDAGQVCRDKAEYDFYMSLISLQAEAKSAVNWLTGPIRTWCQERGADISAFPVSAEQMVRLISLTAEGKVGFNNASGKLLAALADEPEKDPLELVSSLNLLQESSNQVLEGWVMEVIGKMPEKVQEYKKGKKSLIGLFAGEVKRLSKGKADMEQVNKLLIKLLNQ